MGRYMSLQNNTFHTQTKVDAARLEGAIVNDTKTAVANTDGAFELANGLAAEPDAKCMEGGSKLIFVLRRNTTKRCFKRETN